MMSIVPVIAPPLAPTPFAILPPGVPPLFDRLANFNVQIVRAGSAIASLANLLAGPQWGIYGPEFAIIGDSMVAVQFRQDWKVATYPLERGAFESYDKVIDPYDVKMTITKGGSVNDRQVFLSGVERAAASMDLFTAVTPERAYPSMSVVHYDYNRTAQNGAALLKVDIWLQEIRVPGSAEFSNTQSPNGAAPQNGGTVQATPPLPTPPVPPLLPPT